MDKLALSTLYEVVLPIYPEAPKYHVEDTYAAIHKVYQQLLTGGSNEDIIVMGDGTGGALAMSFVQQLKSNNQPLTAILYFFSTMFDVQMNNENNKYEL